MPARTAGICGRLPHDPDRPHLKLGDYLTGVIPPHPVAADYLAALRGGWQILGNNTAGNCVAVTWANFRRLVTTTLTGHGYYPSQAEVWAIYQTQNPDFDPNGTAETNGPGSPADGGMSIQKLLEHLVKVGGPDGVKAAGFAKVNHANTDEVKAAIAIGGALWTGVIVLQVNRQEFTDDKPWSYDANSPEDGGHSVLTGGYGTPEPGSDPAMGGDEKFITWAEETSFEDGFWAHQVQECWLVIWPEQLSSREFMAGMNLAAFAADFTALTGKPFPAQVPPSPGPAPQPVPSPGPAPEDLLAELAALIRAGEMDLLGWLANHGL
jgi:hypothetical protein